MDNRERVYNENPVMKASFISRLFFCWITPLIALGQTRPLNEEDLSVPVPDEETGYTTDKLEKEWKNELEKKKPSLRRALLRGWGGTTLLWILLPLIEESIRVAQPILISHLIKYFNGQIDFQTAALYGSLMCLSAVFCGIIHHPYSSAIVRQGMRMRIAVCGLIYRKALTMNNSNSGSESSGRILNLLSNDASRIEMMLIYGPYLIISPIQAMTIIILLLQAIDITIISGVLLLLAMVPLQAIMGMILNDYRMRTSKIADERINITSEILNGIKIAKMYCWEEPFKRVIENLRKKELNSQSKIFSISAINSSLDMDLPCLITYASIAIFIHFVQKPLLPAYVVFIMAYYTRLCSYTGYYFVKAITCFIAANVSCRRIEELLLKQDTYDRINERNDNEPKCVLIRDLSASWKQNSNVPVLHNISLEANENELLAVVGAVGAGKSSLLMALLGEMPSIKGDVKLNGSIFYVSQEPWIFSSTIKQNILFGKPYIKEKFNKIIKLCALKDDLKMLPYEENTLIGDKGVNLSGGQRARVNLARALYHDPDIYLFDGPLGAVDASVAKHLFDNVINGYLKPKVRIMVTHQVHHLVKADQIIVLKDGKIRAKGKYDELLEDTSINFSSFISNLEKMKNQKLQLHISDHREMMRKLSRMSDSDVHAMENIHTVPSADEVSHLETREVEFEEKRVTGTLGWKVYKHLFSFGIASIIPIVVIFLFALAQAAVTSSEYWLSYWATQEELFHIHNQKVSCKQRVNKTIASTIIDYENLTQFTNSTICDYIPFQSRDQYFIIYTILVASSSIVVLLRSSTFFASALLASMKFHRDMLNSVMQAKIRYFHINPIGRIMNRFSKDIGNVDDVLPLALFDFLNCLSVVLNAIVVAVTINFWILIPLFPLAGIFLYLRSYYVKVSREIKRVENLCRSPIYVHTNNTLVGITTIRASNSQKLILSEYNTHSDYHTQAYFAFISAQRWFAIRLDSLISVYTVIVVFGCIFAKNLMGLSSGQVGLVLTYGLQIMTFFQSTVRQSVEVENLMTSVERIREYSTINGVNLDSRKVKPDDDWPQEGKIEFDNVSFSYDENLPPVLKDMTLTINPRDKIGVVGRTGAGKSTFFQALFRMAEPDGQILIDGVDIRDVSLHDLRSKISIIPQQHTLFTGTIRYNLDPLGLKDDATLWKTLEIVQLKEAVKEMKDGLDSLVQKGGSNLSVGQKQLFCLARAILKKSKILIIDEATANVDFNTDALVQKALRECFKECTVITIAHRLQTIMDSDKILCLSNGQSIYYGRPYDLLQDKQSILYELVHKLGEREEEILTEIARQHIEETETNNSSENSISSNSICTSKVVTEDEEISDLITFTVTDTDALIKKAT